MSGTSRPTRPPVLPPGECEEGSADSPPNLSALDALGSRGAGHSSAADGPGGVHMRSSHSPRRSSSGYFSNESNSVPPSPVLPRPQTADEATQTPSLTAQVIEHAVCSLSTAPVRQEYTQDREYGTILSRKKSTPLRNMQAAVDPVRIMQAVDPERDMQAVLIGREIRQHGDEFNRILEQRAQAAEVRAGRRPAVPREPAVFVCVGLLIFFFGRLLFSHSATYSQSQV